MIALGGLLLLVLGAVAALRGISLVICAAFVFVGATFILSVTFGILA